MQLTFLTFVMFSCIFDCFITNFLVQKLFLNVSNYYYFLCKYISKSKVYKGQCVLFDIFLNNYDVSSLSFSNKNNIIIKNTTPQL